MTRAPDGLRAAVPAAVALDVEGVRRRTDEVMQDLDKALRSAGIRADEPMAPVFEAWKRGVAWQGELAAQAALGAAEMRTQLVDFAAAARKPLSTEDRSVMIAAVKREVWMRERMHLFRTAGIALLVLLVTAGGCYWWGASSASTPVFVNGSDARAACIVAQAVKQDGVEYCPVWLNMSQIGAVPATVTGRR